MAYDPCDPCACIPANIDDRAFHQQALVVLCGILTELQAGTGADVNIASFGGAATSLGQKTMAESMPVVIASDQSPVNIFSSDANSNEVLNIPIASGTGAAFGNFDGMIGALRLATKTITSAGSTTTSLNSTAHTAIVGNIIQIISGAASPSWSYVSAVPTADTITLGFPLPSAPANGVSFIIHQQVPISAVGGQASTDNGSGLLIAHGSLGGALTGSSFGLKLEDAAHAGDGGAGFGIVTRQEATPTNGVNTDGDCQWIKGNVVGALWNSPTPGQTSLELLASIASAASNNATNVKATAGVVYGWSLTNTTATIVYVKLYNKATSPTVGTDTPLVRIGVPATSTVPFHDQFGISFSLGIGYGIVTGAADTDNTAVGANAVLLNLMYK